MGRTDRIVRFSQAASMLHAVQADAYAACHDLESVIDIPSDQGDLP